METRHGGEFKNEKIKVQILKFYTIQNENRIVCFTAKNNNKKHLMSVLNHPFSSPAGIFYFTHLLVNDQNVSLVENTQLV